MSEQKIKSSVGRDQYNISGDKTKLTVDNSIKASSDRRVVLDIVLGITISVSAGFILFQLGFN